MRSHPYVGIPEAVASVAQRLIEKGGPYHRVHAARLARTAEIVVNELGNATKVLELGTSGFIPLLLRELRPELEVHVTHLVSGLPKTTDVSLELGDEKITVRAYCIDLEQDAIPADDGYYDVVICCEVLEHMEIDPMFMLSEINRVLREDGKLVLTTPNITSSRALDKMMRGYEPYFYMQYHKSREYNRHNYEYSAPGLRSLLTAAGFDGRIWSEDLFEDPLHEVIGRLRVAGYTFTEVGDNLLATVRKYAGVQNRWPHGLYV